MPLTPTEERLTREPAEETRRSIIIKELATPKQLAALVDLYWRNPAKYSSYQSFLESCNLFWDAHFKTIMLTWAGMIVGIEQDGYTHT